MTLLQIGSVPRSHPRGRLSRRRLLQIAAAMAAGGGVGCMGQSGDEARAAKAAGVAPWPEVEVPRVTHPGYGTYPDYDAIGERGPWPNVLAKDVRRKLEKFADLILPATATGPAPSAVGIGDFFEDWVSAPYPYMTDTRNLVYPGTAWLDAQMRMDHGTDWMLASERQATALMDRMRDVAARGASAPEPDAGVNDTSKEAMPDADRFLANPATMYTHLRKLVIGAYYTTPEGEADLGHIHAQPIVGDYPGPTGEALEHIQGVMADLDLGWDDLPIGPPPYPDKAPYRFTGDEPA